MRNHCSHPYPTDRARTIPRALLEPIRTQFREADAMGPDVPPFLPLALTD